MSASRKEAAKDIAYADWASKGKTAGFFWQLAEALRGEMKEGSTWNVGLEHHALAELGRMKAVEEILFKLLDPLGSFDDKPIQKLPVANYGVGR
jgi:hypothetical protein